MDSGVSRKAPLVLRFALLLAPAAAAQTITATLTGVVRDQSRGVLPGATITVRSVDTEPGAARVVEMKRTPRSSHVIERRHDDIAVPVDRARRLRGGRRLRSQA